MAKKAELLEEATKLNLDVSSKNTIAEITKAIESEKHETENNKPTAGDQDEDKFAKAGKRSKKSVEEAEAEAEKQERKAKIAAGELDEEHQVKKGPAPKVRARIERRGKKYRKATENIDLRTRYEISEALKLVQTTSTSKFDGSVEMHINLNVDPKHADQNIRGSLVLPHGTGRAVRVAVFANDDDIKAAKDAGADLALGDELLDRLQKQQIDFDVLISTPQNMPKLGKFAKVLGPKGLMPNPKSGTVSNDVAKAVTEAKGGRVEYRVDKSGIIHLVIGKVSFETPKLTENANVVLSTIVDARPASIKSDYITSISVSASMGPGIKVSL